MTAKKRLRNKQQNHKDRNVAFEEVYRLILKNKLAREESDVFDQMGTIR